MLGVATLLIKQYVRELNLLKNQNRGSIKNRQYISWNLKPIKAVRYREKAWKEPIPEKSDLVGLSL